jgi:hypothetical protein
LGDRVPPLCVVANARLQVALQLGDSLLEGGSCGGFLRIIWIFYIN